LDHGHCRPGNVAYLQSLVNELKFGSRSKLAADAGLAISGGIDVPVVLVVARPICVANFGGFEGRALRDGDRLLLARPPGSPPRLQPFLHGLRHTIG